MGKYSQEEIPTGTVRVMTDDCKVLKIEAEGRLPFPKFADASGPPDNVSYVDSWVGSKGACLQTQVYTSI